MAKRELRAFGAVVLYRRSGDRVHLLEIDWERVAERRRWNDLVSIVEAIRAAEQAKEAAPVDLRSTIDLVSRDKTTAARDITSSEDAQSSDAEQRGT